MAMLGGFISSLGGGQSRLSADTDDIIIGDSDTTFSADSDNNISIGIDALGTATTDDADNNIAIGTEALKALTTSDGIVAIGHQALKALTEGVGNVAVGYTALSTLSSGDYNVAIGYTAAANLTGNQSIAIGYEALKVHGIGSHNIAIGWGAMKDTNGHADTLASVENIFIGTVAGGGTWATNDSNRNIGIGHYSLYGAMNGAVENTALGYKAGYAITTGTYNTLVGSNAGLDMTTGASNVAVGYTALDNLETGDKNTAVGAFALSAFDNSGSGNNTAVGQGAGIIVSSGKGNTIMGSDAGAVLTTGSNNTVIGYISDIDVNSQSNTTVIGVGSVFKFLSKEYTCDHADGEDGKSAASEASPLKLPAYSIIKSISVIIKTLSNLGTFNVRLYHSTDTAAPADDTALGGTPVEVLGANASDTCSGNSASAVDIALGSGAVVKQSYYNAYGGAGLPVGTADRYIHVGQAGTSNGDTDPSTAGVLKVLVEYVGLD